MISRNERQEINPISFGTHALAQYFFKVTFCWINGCFAGGLQGKLNEGVLTFFFREACLTNNTIYNFTFTRSGNTFTAYINGVQENPNSGSTIGTITSSDTSFQTPNNTGSDQSGVDDLEGRVYHVLAYSSALTASQVSTNYNALKSRYGY